MNIELISGTYNSNETLDLVTELVHVKIKYLEKKIESSMSEEEIKVRENRIKNLQREFYDFKQRINQKDGSCKIQSTIQLN